MANQAATVGLFTSAIHRSDMMVYPDRPCR